MRPRFWLMLVVGIMLLCPAGSQAEQPSSKPKRAILLIIDGVHWQAPQRLGLKNMQALAAEGASFRQAWLVPPIHPKTGPWAEMYTTSLPNPVMLAGTAFITKDHRLIQEMFSASAHINSAQEAYADLDRGNRFLRTEKLRKADDAWVVDQSIQLLKDEPIDFMRMHLQDAGLAGYDLAMSKDVPSDKKDVWAEGSAYIEKSKEADRQLGRFVKALKEMGKYDDTFLVVTADHGQAKGGAHPPESEESAITPLIFVGPGVARGRVLPYAEHIDIVPTICHVMGKDPPNRNGGSGRVLSEIFAGAEVSAHPPRQYLEEVSALWQEYLTLTAEAGRRAEPAVAKALAGAKETFYDTSRFLAWPEAGTLERLVEHNRAVVSELRKALRKSTSSQSRSSNWSLHSRGDG